MVSLDSISGSIPSGLFASSFMVRIIPFEFPLFHQYNIQMETEGKIKVIKDTHSAIQRQKPNQFSSLWLKPWADFRRNICHDNIFVNYRANRLGQRLARAFELIDQESSWFSNAFETRVNTSNYVELHERFPIYRIQDYINDKFSKPELALLCATDQARSRAQTYEKVAEQTLRSRVTEHTFKSASSLVGTRVLFDLVYQSGASAATLLYQPRINPQIVLDQMNLSAMQILERRLS